MTPKRDSKVSYLGLNCTKMDYREKNTDNEFP